MRCLKNMQLRARYKLSEVLNDIKFKGTKICGIENDVKIT